MAKLKYQTCHRTHPGSRDEWRVDTGCIVVDANAYSPRHSHVHIRSVSLGDNLEVRRSQGGENELREPDEG